MRRHIVVLVVGLGVAAVLLGTWLAALLSQSAPRPEIRLYTVRESYRMGELVIARFENVGNVAYCTLSLNPWEIHRRVDGEWEPVNIWGDLPAVDVVVPGEMRELRWVAGEFRHPPDPPMEMPPGDYRVFYPGYFCDPATKNPISDALPVFAYDFELVA